MLADTFGMHTMTTTLEPGDMPPPAAHQGGDPARDLRITTAAVRVAFTWFGTRKALSAEQRNQIAEGFEAETGSISAGKKLLNTKHPAFRAVTAVRNQILAYWRDHSLPFPEPGIRLIRQDHIDRFQAQMEAYRADLADAVANLDRHFFEMREEARHRLGSLFNAGDYPATLDGLFAVAWDFPNVEPPDYLMQLRPELYEAERTRVAQQFDEAVRLAEAAFIEQFSSVVSHLCDRLAKGDDGQPKIFRDSAIHNLGEFFERFKALNLHSNPQLDALVEQARQAISGASPARLRHHSDFRQAIAGKLADVEHQLAGMMTDKPRRRILRPTINTSPEAES
jgi:hypothetical protein